tara:strand:+ start:2462 stop:2833 length:372 start_codon:yes stop_codon:yes gene_type:complete
MTSSQSQNSDSQVNSAELKPEQALGLVSLGLMQKLTNKGLSSLNWLEEEAESKADLHALRQRLELTSLAIETGAPLSTLEVTKLLGAKPVSDKIERGGLVARRLSRNVWKLNRTEKDSSYWRN